MDSVAITSTINFDNPSDSQPHTDSTSDADVKNQVAELFKEYADYVYHIALRMLGNTAKAEDIVQDVFIQVYKHYHSFRGDAKVSTWIYKITINQCLYLIRSEKRLLQRIRSFWEEQRTKETGYHTLDQIEIKELANKVLMEIPEQYRSVLILRELENVSPDEICTILELKPSTYKIRLERAKKMLAAVCQQISKE